MVKERLIISVSFTSEEIELYDYAKNMPNSSYYIKQLIKEDIQIENEKKANVIQEIDVEDMQGMMVF